jgi:hypothetical protein
MAMAMVELSGASSTTTDASTFNGNSGTASGGDLVIATFYLTGYSTNNTGRTPIISGGGLTWRLDQTLSTGTGGQDRIFIATTFASSTTVIIPNITTFGACTGCIIKVSRITGIEGQAQLYIRQSATATGSTANPLITLPTAALTGNGMWGVIVNLAGATNFSAPAGWTSHFEIALPGTTPTGDMMIFYRVGGFTGTTFSCTSAQTVLWNAFVMELYNVGTGPVTFNSSTTTGFFGVSAGI